MDALSVAILAGALHHATPLLLVTLGGLIASRAGILDVGLEGKMLAGAFVGTVVSYYTRDAGLGLLAAMLAGALLGGFMWLCHRRLEVDIVIAGLALNLLVAGATVFILRERFGVRGSLVSDRIAGFGPWLPGTGGIPGVGPVLSSLTFLDYLAPLLALLVALILRHTRIGLHLRAAGHGDGSAALTRGIQVDALRGGALMVGGALAAAGGAYLSLAVLTTFVENMSAGRGFLAIALLLLGRSRPGATVLWTYLFGLALSLESVLQLMHMPSQLVLALPYATTLAILAVWNRSNRGK
jgi:simple sugar transport system permease protein